VQPTGPFEGDPNVTNKKFPGNLTQSYRSRHPLRVPQPVHDWQGHDRETLDKMLSSLRLPREQGRDVIEDPQRPTPTSQRRAPGLSSSGALGRVR